MLSEVKFHGITKKSGAYMGGRCWKEGRTDCEWGEDMEAGGEVGGVGGVTWGGAGGKVGRSTLFSFSSCITSLTTSPRLD